MSSSQHSARGQPEIEQRAGRPPRRVGAQPDPQQAEALQGLALVEGHQLAHHPAGRLPAAALSRLPAGERPGRAGRGGGLLDQVVDRGLSVAGGGPRQAVQDQPPLPHESVAGLEIGREERGRLPAVAEREQLPAAAGPVRQLLSGGSAWYSAVASTAAAASLPLSKQPHHAGAARPAGQAPVRGARTRPASRRTGRRPAAEHPHGAAAPWPRSPHAPWPRPPCAAPRSARTAWRPWRKRSRLARGPRRPRLRPRLGVAEQQPGAAVGPRPRAT